MKVAGVRRGAGHVVILVSSYTLAISVVGSRVIGVQFWAHKVMRLMYPSLKFIV